MAHQDSSKSIIDLALELGNALLERERLLEESLPPQLRKQSEEPSVLVYALATGPCEGYRTHEGDVTGEWGQQCGSNGVERPNLEGCPILCEFCNGMAC